MSDTENKDKQKRSFGWGRELLIAVAFLLLGYYVARQILLEPKPSEGIKEVVQEEQVAEEYWEETEGGELYAPEIDYTVSKHQKKFFKEMFKDCRKSKRKLVKACDYKNKIVRNFAVGVAGVDAGNFNLAQVCNLFDFCYEGWHYVNDPASMEYLAKASETVENGLNGDCDDFAVLLCALIHSVGGEARVNYAWGPDGGHAFTEVNLGKTNKDDVISYIQSRYPKMIYFRENLNGKIDKDGNTWLNLDWWAEHPGGPYFEYNIGYTFYITQNYCDAIDKD